MRTQKSIASITKKHSQQGAALIVVLLVLILIMLVGTIVVRNSNTDLRLATASQIDSLLFITAEQPNAVLEKEVKRPDTEIFSETDGIIGHFMSDVNSANKNDKIITCFRPQSTDVFNYDKVAVYSDKNTFASSQDRKDINGGTDPFCQVGRSADYVSQRNAAIAQVVFSLPTGATASSSSGKTFKDSPSSTNIVNGQNKSFKINVETTSAIPAYATASNSDINSCFNLGSGKSTEQCLTDKSVPSKTVNQTYLARFQDEVENTTAGSSGAATDSGDTDSTDGSNTADTGST